TKLLAVVIPAGAEIDVRFRLLRISPKRVGRDARQRRDAGMVEEIPFPQDGKCVGISDQPLEEIDSVCGFHCHGRASSAWSATIMRAELMHHPLLRYVVAIGFLFPAFRGAADQLQRETIPGKWIEPLLPEDLPALDYPK